MRPHPPSEAPQPGAYYHSPASLGSLHGAVLHEHRELHLAHSQLSQPFYCALFVRPPRLSLRVARHHVLSVEVGLVQRLLRRGRGRVVRAGGAHERPHRRDEAAVGACPQVATGARGLRLLLRWRGRRCSGRGWGRRHQLRGDPLSAQWHETLPGLHAPLPLQLPASPASRPEHGAPAEEAKRVRRQARQRTTQCQCPMTPTAHPLVLRNLLRQRARPLRGHGGRVGGRLAEHD